MGFRGSRGASQLAPSRGSPQHLRRARQKGMRPEARFSISRRVEANLRPRGRRRTDRCWCPRRAMVSGCPREVRRLNALWGPGPLGRRPTRTTRRTGLRPLDQVEGIGVALNVSSLRAVPQPRPDPRSFGYTSSPRYARVDGWSTTATPEPSRPIARASVAASTVRTRPCLRARRGWDVASRPLGAAKRRSRRSPYQPCRRPSRGSRCRAHRSPFR